jgi:hypothetical protein
MRMARIHTRIPLSLTPLKEYDIEIHFIFRILFYFSFSRFSYNFFFFLRFFTFFFSFFEHLLREIAVNFRHGIVQT